MAIDKRFVLNTFDKMAARNWTTLYWAIDLHGTCIESNYSTTEISKEFLPCALPTLKRLSAREDCVLIMFTCSHPHEIEQYLQLFKQHDIHFKYVNENPEVPDTALGNFTDKFYTNFYLDDKAGFNPNTDWMQIYYALNELDNRRENEST